MEIVNWNQKEDYNDVFWRQNLSQMWTETEFNVSKDISSWKSLTKAEQDVYKKVLAGLTALDTLQGDYGMPILLLQTKDLKSKAVMSFMGMMENIHAKSYSYIFTTLLPSEETNYLLGDWAKNNIYLKDKVDTILEKYGYAYQKLTDLDIYMGYVASVFLESFLFYSGFYWPLYLAGNGKMTSSGEIIRKIMMDESIHGSFIGTKAQELYATFDVYQKQWADEKVLELLENLMTTEIKYTSDIYSQIGRQLEVLDYMKYNANKALQLLGYDAVYQHAEINPVVINGLDTKNATHDFFHNKGSGYVLPTETNQELSDDDFSF